MREHIAGPSAPERQAAAPSRPRPTQATAFLALASAIGNRAAATLARSALDAGTAGAGTAPGPGTAGAGGTAARDDPAADGGPGQPGFDAGGATDAERVTEIRARLGDGRDVGEIWRSFADLKTQANAHPDLWVPSVQRHPDLAHDEAVEALFKQRVEQLAIEQLTASRNAVATEMDELGVAADGAADPKRADAVVRLQQQAGQLKEALRAKDALLQVPVGWEEPPPTTDPAARAANGPKRLLFQPGKPPPPQSESAQRDSQPYEKVLREYEPIEAIIAQGMQHPALFAMAESGSLGGFSAAAPEQAQQDVGQTLHALLAKVEGAAAAVGGSLDHRDLRPLHDTVLGAPPFTEPFDRAVAQRAVTAHDEMRTWLALGLGLPAALVLLVPGAGTIAAIIGAVGSATQAGLSYDHYLELKRAREARTRPGEDLVTKEQLDDAAIAAALDAAFAFLDGVALLRGAGRVLGSVADLAAVPVPDRDAVLADAMTALGPGPAIESAGGIEAVRAATPGTPAATRAEAFVHGVDQALGRHLGELPAEADLLGEAQRFVAQHAGVDETRALETLLPQYGGDTGALKQAIEDARRGAVAGWAQMTVDGRGGLVHQEALRRLPGMPPPRMVLSPTKAKGSAHFDPFKWEIVYSAQDFTGAAITEGELIYLKSIAMHEAEHGIQSFQTAAAHIQTAPNRAAAIAELKGRGYFPAMVDAAASAPPMDAATLTRLKPQYDEMLGAKQGFMAQVEDAIVGANERHAAARSRWDAAWETYKRLDAAGAHKDKLDAAAVELTQYHREMAREENVARSYYNLAIEQGAYDVQHAYLLEEIKAARVAREAHMQQLVLASVVSATGVAIGAVATYVVTHR